MTETKQWMGLHNHDRHFYSPGYGDRCGKCWYCSPETPCYCCLQAEVEALRAQVDAVRELHRSCLTLSVDLGGCMLDEHDADAGNPSVCLHDNEDYPCPTIRILDGGDA